MAYLVIEDYRLGLDTRKFWLSAPPGSLKTCQNGHITPGGDIEKRKAFVPFDDDLPAGTFGLQTVASGLVVFGSGDLASDFPITLGTRQVNYVRCQHPDATTAMTAILCSEQFGGLAWCAARFADNNVFAFHNGTLIRHWRNGLVLTGLEADSDLVTELAAELTAELPDYTIEEPVDATDSVDVKAPLDGQFTAAIVEDSTSGSLASTIISESSDGTAGVGAAVNLTLTGGTSGSISSITAPDGDGGTVELLAAAVAYSASLANTASLLAQEINRTVTTPKYTATAVGTTVTLAAPPSLGSAVNGSNNVTVTYDGTLTFNSSGAVALTASADNVYVAAMADQQNNGQVVSGSVRAFAAGGVSAYAFTWESVSNPDGITMSQIGHSAQFSKYLDPGQTVTGYFRCRIVDSSTPAQTAYTRNILVVLSCEWYERPEGNE